MNSNSNLPPGCSMRDIEHAFGDTQCADCGRDFIVADEEDLSLEESQYCAECRARNCESSND